MTILEGDIKLLKSAVMADTTDGGGAMTGTPVVDGQSNNLFPDTSEVDRALGRVNTRKVFGVAHTSNTETLLGAHAIITDAPDDPLVHCTLMQTPGWSDTRTTAKNIIERYLVKGSRISPRMMDTHYLGSLQLRLVSAAANADFPKGGDAIALSAPDGHEQYVRVTKVTFSTQTIYVTEGNGTVEFLATIATCDLGQRLDYDFPGPPPSRLAPATDSLFTKIYSTTVASGAQFYGIKPLVADAVIGDISAMASGIFTPLVPAATIETPIIDQYPLTARGSLSRTAAAALSLPTVSMTLQSASVLYTPTAIEPRSVSMTHGATVFTDDGAGVLKQGSLAVGKVDYVGKTITMSSGSPAYGWGTVNLTYRPATPAGAATHSDAMEVTRVNQGLSFVFAIEPPPAPGTFSLSYMAQGRWYDLADNADGKLAGADGGYGSGTINYSSGSVAFTLGAIPDVGSPIIYQWGDTSSAVAIPTASLPTKLSAELAIDFRAQPATVTASWSRGGTNYTASTSASGVMSGGATGRVEAGRVIFSPSVLPDGPVTLGYSLAPDHSTSAISVETGIWQLALTPVTPGSISFNLMSIPEGAFDSPGLLHFVDNGAGALLCTSVGAQGVAIGTIDYTTGKASIASSLGMTVYENVTRSYSVITASGTATNYYESKVRRDGYIVSLYLTSAITVAHSGGSPVASQPLSCTPVWSCPLPINAGLKLKTNALAFSVGGDLYVGNEGGLKRGWSMTAGNAVTADAGSVPDSGVITVSSLPANGVNTLTWFNVAQDMTTGKVSQGVFRTASAPLKTGVMQLQAGAAVGNASAGGIITGANWSGTVDFQRGVVRWRLPGGNVTVNGYPGSIECSTLSYNAVFLQYLPLDGALLGLETARLPLDGKVPIFRSGGLVVVHNTQSYSLPNPLVKGTVYNVGRVRVAAMKVKTLTGATVDSTQYSTDLDAGTITFPANADLTGFAQPFTVEHRIEDMQLCSVADISGKLTFTRPLTHDFPAATSFASSALIVGDVFARAYNPIEQTTWTGVWSDSLVGSAPLANFNEAQNPLAVTNKGAITEKWAVIFTNSTSYRVIGQSVGEIATGSTGADCAPLNPATGVPYFTISALGWGNGWAAGNVYRFNTAACGAPLWVVRTVLQGPATLQDDKFTLAFRGDVDHP